NITSASAQRTLAQLRDKRKGDHHVTAEEIAHQPALDRKEGDHRLEPDAGRHPVGKACDPTGSQGCGSPGSASGCSSRRSTGSASSRQTRGSTGSSSSSPPLLIACKLGRDTPFWIVG